MTLAEEAISEILTALDEYGSDVTLVKIVSGQYDPATGQSDIRDELPLKALISTQTKPFSSQGNQAFQANSTSIMLYNEEAPTTDWKVVIKSEEFKITAVKTTTLQNVDIKYDLTVEK